jgi:hypothetical protein
MAKGMRTPLSTHMMFKAVRPRLQMSGTEQATTGLLGLCDRF